MDSQAHPTRVAPHFLSKNVRIPHTQAHTYGLVAKGEVIHAPLRRGARHEGLEQNIDHPLRSQDIAPNDGRL